MVRDVRHDAESAAHGATRRRAYRLRRDSALASAGRPRLLGDRHAVGVVLDRVAHVGSDRAGALSRSTATSSGARCVPPAAAVSILKAEEASMTTYQLRPLSIGEILDGALVLLRRHFGLVLGIAVVCE